MAKNEKLENTGQFVKLRCNCSNALTIDSVELDEAKRGIVVVCHCDKCYETIYHEGLVRGSHLKEPLHYDDVVGPEPSTEMNFLEELVEQARKYRLYDMATNYPEVRNFVRFCFREKGEKPSTNEELEP